MKEHSKADTARLNVTIRRDIKEAMKQHLGERQREEGAYVSLGSLFGKAAKEFLERAGVGIPNGNDREPRKPMKSVARRKVAARA